jgi:Tfp pilus assembly protein PilF
MPDPLPRQDSTIQAMVQQALRHHQAGRLAEAERMYQQVLAIDPRHADALHLLGMVAYQTGRHDAAVELIRKAIATHKTAASYHANLGNVLQAQDKLDEAEESYRRALSLKPDLPEVYLNLGHVLQAQGNVMESLASYRRTLAINPELAEAQVAEAMALLLQGNFDAGWHNFERRWLTKDYDTPMRRYPQPLWKGEALASGRLLIWGEQGIGDEIMFAGLIPDAIRTGNRLALDSDPRLQSLFARSFPGVRVISGYDPERNADLDIAAHLPSGSLPGIFRTNRAAFAETRSPYLFADPAERERYRARYTDGRRLAGLAWHTRNRKTGRKRSMDLSLFAPLFAQPDVRWVSLQYGDHDALEREAAEAAAPVLIDHEVNQLSNLDRFAAQVAAMDLVITIDNSTAHLAAALGIPTWLLLPFAPNWRWLLDCAESPWYPAIRIFRQPRLGDWSSVVQEVQIALSTRIQD